MRSVLWGLLIFVVCLPLAFVLFLIPAAKFPAMDAFTMKLPMGIRSAVAEMTLNNADYGKDSSKATDRAIQFDPDNAEAWAQRCHGEYDETRISLAACRKAIALNPSGSNFNGQGTAQERAKDYCAAEDSYTRAIQASSNNATYLRNMARAALRCGHVGASVAGFEVAEGLDAKAAADSDEEDDVKTDLVTDREYLTVVYGKTNEQAKAGAACAKAHADWKSCQCELNDAGVKCSGVPADSVSKK
jgi:tetratricopeptide (TPR) repeat protein